MDSINSIIIYLGKIDVEIDVQDQAFIVLCSLLLSYENFVENML